MKSFLKACALAFFSMTIGGPLANMAVAGSEMVMPQFVAATCPVNVPTEEEFFDRATKVLKVTVRTFTDSGQAKMRGLYNSMMSRSNIPPIPDAAKFYYAEIDAMNTGVVLMLGGCVVPGSVIKVDKANFTAKAGVTIDEMILAPIGPEM